MYEVEFTERAWEGLARLDRQTAQRILNKIRWLAENFDSITTESLTGHWQGMCKLWVGDYRVVYTYESSTRRLILVHLIGHRREVYKIN